MKALIVWGGWDGHEPDKVASLFADILTSEGFTVEVTNDMERFAQVLEIEDLKLIVPVITMSKITSEQREAVTTAVGERGVALAGCHGGMCDAFREDTEWQFMTGGQWVSHPGNDGVAYWVNIDRENPHQITDGLEDFEVKSEQYYLHTDPGNNVLATCDFPTAGVDGPHTNNPCKMPVIWTKWHGKGKVFYNSLGHSRAVLEEAAPRELMRRGFLWATDKLT